MYKEKCFAVVRIGLTSGTGSVSHLILELCLLPFPMIAFPGHRKLGACSSKEGNAEGSRETLGNLEIGMGYVRESAKWIPSG